MLIPHVSTEAHSVLESHTLKWQFKEDTVLIATENTGMLRNFCCGNTLLFFSSTIVREHNPESL